MLECRKIALGGEIIYAVIRTGGKQYRVEPGQVLAVDRLTAEEGQRLELTEVLMVSEGDTLAVGNPTVAGAKVIAEVVGHGRADKVVVGKYKAKTRYRRKAGHRQPFTTLAIREIQSQPEAASEESPAPARRRRSTQTAAGPRARRQKPAEEGE